MNVKIRKIALNGNQVVATGTCQLDINNTYQLVVFPEFNEVICTGWLADDSKPAKTRNFRYTFE